MVNTCEHILKTDNIIQQLLSIWSLKDGALVGRQILQIIQEQQQLLLLLLLLLLLQIRKVITTINMTISTYIYIQLIIMTRSSKLGTSLHAVALPRSACLREPWRLHGGVEGRAGHCCAAGRATWTWGLMWSSWKNVIKNHWTWWFNHDKWGFNHWTWGLKTLENRLLR